MGYGNFIGDPPIVLKGSDGKYHLQNEAWPTSMLVHQSVLSGDLETEVATVTEDYLTITTEESTAVYHFTEPYDGTIQCRKAVLESVGYPL